VKKIFSLALILAVAGLAAPVSAAKTETPNPGEALDQWVEAMESGDATKVVALYDQDAVFYSMFAVKPLKTQAQRLEYYKKAVAEPDLVVDIDDFECESMAFKASCKGQYTFHHTEEGEDIESPGEFVFRYVLKNGKWLITEHRSTKIETEPKVEKKKYTDERE